MKNPNQNIHSTLNQVHAELESGSVDIPYWELSSIKDGPVLLVTAAFHGNEVQGCEVIRRFREIAIEKIISGKIILFPFVNKLAIQKRFPHMCSEKHTSYSVPKEKDLFTVWPGKVNGNSAERLANALFPVFTEKTTHYIDIHCYPANRGATILFPEEYSDCLDFARQTGIRFAESFITKPPEANPRVLSTLPTWFVENGRTAIVLEMSGQYTIIEEEIRQALNALENCAAYLGIFQNNNNESESKKETIVIKGPKREVPTISVIAPISGLFCKSDTLRTSDYVEKGQQMGILMKDDDLAANPILAPASGYLWTYGCLRQDSDIFLSANHPYVEENETIAEII